MTREEFDAWMLGEHCQLFPEVKAWLDTHDPRGFELVLANWHAVLARLPLSEARRVTNRMVAGDLAHPDRWGVSRLPAAIRAAAPQYLTAADLAGKKYNPYTGELT